MIRAVACLVFLPCSGGRAVDVPKPEVTTKFRYYDIRGNNADELAAQMKARGPHEAGQPIFFGRTHWKINWKFNFRSQSGTCAMNDIKISVHVEQTLPQWNATAESPSKLVERWEHFLGALKEHENGHRDFALRAADQIAAGLAKISGPASCAGMTARANQLGNEIIHSVQAEEIRYDDKTQHGKAQGVVFP
jgi:predicted secreted Zn-dependent protease